MEKKQQWKENLKQLEILYIKYSLMNEQQIKEMKKWEIEIGIGKQGNDSNIKKIKRKHSKEEIIKRIEWNCCIICLHLLEEYLTEINPFLLFIEREEERNHIIEINTSFNDILQIVIKMKYLIEKNDEEYQKVMNLITKKQEQNEMRYQHLWIEIHLIQVWFLMKIKTFSYSKNIPKNILFILTEFIEVVREKQELIEMYKEIVKQLMMKNEIILQYQERIEDIRKEANEKIKNLVEMYNTLVDKQDEEREEAKRLIIEEKESKIKQLSEENERIKKEFSIKDEEKSIQLQEKEKESLMYERMLELERQEKIRKAMKEAIETRNMKYEIDIINGIEKIIIDESMYIKEIRNKEIILLELPYGIVSEIEKDSTIFIKWKEEEINFNECEHKEKRIQIRRQNGSILVKRSMERIIIFEKLKTIEEKKEL